MIADDLPRVRHQGDGVATAFPFGFRAYAAAHVKVKEIVRATGVEADKTQGVHFSVTLNDPEGAAGGTVTASVAPAGTLDWLVYRDTPVEQTDDYTSTGRAPLDVLEARVDRLTALVQDLAEETGRAIRLPRGDAALAVQPGFAARALGFLRADANGIPAWVTNLLDPGAVAFSNAGEDFVALADVAAMIGFLAAVTTARQVATADSLAGGGDLGADRTLRLVADSAAPGNAKVYGTLPDGTRAWLALLWQHLPDGVPIDRVYASYPTNADLSVTIPFDDTLPQSAEGTQILEVTIAPKRIASRIRLRFQAAAVAASNGPINMAAALFNGGSDAIAATYSGDTRSGAAGHATMALEFEHVPGSLSPQTYTIRVGAASGTMRLNGNPSARFFGGIMAATLIADEIKAS